MKIDEGIVARQWEQAALEQLSRDLTRDGYMVERETDIKGLHVDLVASRGDERILFEIKTAGANGQAGARPSIDKLQALAKELGARFRLVFVRVPRETSIYIEGLESALETYLAEHVPETVLAISRDATVLDVDGIELTALTYLDGFDLEGTGEVLLSLPTDSIDVNLPFAFAAAFAPTPGSVAGPLRVTSLKSFDIDLSPLR